MSKTWLPHEDNLRLQLPSSLTHAYYFFIFIFSSLFYSIGSAASNQDNLLRGSEKLNSNSNPSRQLKNPNAKGRPAVVNWRCEDSPFDTCTSFQAGRGGLDTCQQCCECECDGTEVEQAKDKCSILQEEDAASSVSCADGGMVDYNGTGGDCDSTCNAVCNP